MTARLPLTLVPYSREVSSPKMCYSGISAMSRIPVTTWLVQCLYKSFWTNSFLLRLLRTGAICARLRRPSEQCRLVPPSPRKYTNLWYEMCCQAIHCRPDAHRLLLFRLRHYQTRQLTSLVRPASYFDTRIITRAPLQVLSFPHPRLTSAATLPTMTASYAKPRPIPVSHSDTPSSS